MSSNFADGLSEEEFRRSIEARLRENRPEEAVARLRRLLTADCIPGGILPERFLTVQSSDLVLLGWAELFDRIRAFDEPGRPITAISVAFGWPGEHAPRPDADGRLSPHIETGFFDDSAYPFSESDRDNLLEGYSYYGCTWAGEAKATESTLTLLGIDDLHGALAMLEAKLLASEEPDEAGIRAGSLGSCLLSVLLFQAVRDRIANDGLPRPLCVMAGSNGVYPYFDAPVVGMPDHALKAAELDMAGAHQFVPGPRYSSLLVTGIPRARKRAVLVIDESEAETAVRLAALRNLPQVEEPQAVPQPEPVLETVGEAPAEGTIIPNPAGPLMVKRKAVQSWNLQDLLNPGAPPTQPIDRAPSAPKPDFPVAPEPQTEPGDFQPAAELPKLPELAKSSPLLEPAEPPRLPEQPEPPAGMPVDPGFISLGYDVESRLRALVARPAPTLEPLLAPEPPADLEAALEADLQAPGDPMPPSLPEPDELLPAPDEPMQANVQASPPVPDLGPVWPLGLDWLESPPAPAAPVTEPRPRQARPGLWTRLRGWLAGRR